MVVAAMLFTLFFHDPVTTITGSIYHLCALFFFNDTATTEIYTLSLHDALPIAILRAGLGMVEGIAQLIPSARVGHIGIYREHDTLQPVDYYFKIPEGRDARDFVVLDPMLATGGSAVDAVGALKHAGAQRIRFLCLVAAPEGVRS